MNHDHLYPTVTAESMQQYHSDRAVKEEKCVCKDRGLERGDTLYISADWDGGIGFDYIHNIQFCPVCGKELPEWRR